MFAFIGVWNEKGKENNIKKGKLSFYLNPRKWGCEVRKRKTMIYFSQKVKIVKKMYISLKYEIKLIKN